MRNGMAETVAEANAQQYTLPANLENWGAFALLIDGYKIAEELGIDLAEWIETQQQRFEQTGRWDMTVLELRLMLFQKQRSNYWAGYTYHEQDEAVDSLLRALSQKTGLPYGQEGLNDGEK